MKYRNIKSGAVIESDSRITGERWELISESPVSVEEAEPKEKKRRKKNEQ